MHFQEILDLKKDVNINIQSVKKYYVILKKSKNIIKTYFYLDF